MSRKKNPLSPKMVAIGGLALVAIVAVGVVAGLRDEGPRLVSRTDGSVSGAVSAPGAKQYYTALVGQVCVSDTTTAKIHSVEPVNPHGGIEVTDFSVVPVGAGTPGAQPGRLRAERTYGESVEVTDLCDPDESAADLAIEVLKPSAEDAWASAYEIKYEIDGASASERIGFGFGVCEIDLDLCDHSETWSD